MNTVDYLVLVASIVGIALYGILRTRGRRNLHDYLRGQKRSSWFVIGLSVMATQASAITFLSTPGQGYASGMAFVQNYFAMPLALIIIAAFFLPIYRRFNVYTAYEYLGNRFDKKTRLLAAGLFLMQRALAAGITIYAPAIVLSTVFGWSLSLTIIASGLVVLAYTVAGGSDAVTHTQKYQIGIIFIGMVTAFFILLSKIPCSFTDAITLAGHFGKTNAVSFNPDLKERYTFWTGMLGGIFLMLSYFGTDQSQVQRYIAGDDLRESRLGLMFNALFKIPMQFGILLLGVMLFVFYQFHPSPIFFNESVLQQHLKSDIVIHDSFATPPRASSIVEGAEGLLLKSEQDYYEASNVKRSQSISDWLDARRRGDAVKESDALQAIKKESQLSGVSRDFAISILKHSDPSLNTNDADYVFITFILNNLPHGLIGLLVACFFFATLSSKAAELNALASTSTIDFYRHIIRPPEDNNHTPDHTASAHGTSERHYVRASKIFTIFWGLLAIGFALFLHMSENLIQASNIIGSLFSGVVLGLFLIAFFFRFIKGSAAFLGAIFAKALVLIMFFTLNISYLWYNLIGCAACILLAALIQLILGPPREPSGFPVVTDPSAPPPA